MAIIKVCEVCGSDQITKDATASWNPVTGQWELCGVQDYEICGECHEEGDDMSVDKEVELDPTVAYAVTQVSGA